MTVQPIKAGFAAFDGQVNKNVLDLVFRHAERILIQYHNVAQLSELQRALFGIYTNPMQAPLRA